MKIISIVGRKKSGKTTLLEHLIPELKKRGLKVAVIKHGSHEFTMDTPGTDTFKFYQSGADAVGICSRDRGAFIWRDFNQDHEIEDFIRTNFKGYDLILTEGFKNRNFPKIEVLNSENHSTLIDDIEDSRIALITDKKDIIVNVPLFSWNEVGKITDFILKL